MKTAIENTLKNYLKAFYQQDFDTMLSLLYEDDMMEYRNTFIGFAEQMDIFGETIDFLQKIKIKDLETLKAMSVHEFMTCILKMVTRSIGEVELKRMIEETEILDIDEADLLTIVKYRIPIKFFDDWDYLESDVNMIFSEGSWKLFFKSGLNQVLQSFQKDIDLYYERKAKDNLNNLQYEGDLTKYNLIGYKNLEGGIVFEARFKDAGDFSEGLAYVQLMKKYGYINLKGDLVIKPQFIEARDFLEDLAAVKLRTEQEGNAWGFIDKKGNMVVAPKYQEVAHFSEGLCAVRLSGKWGYINKEGDTIIPHQFSEAGNFSDGVTYVELIRANRDRTELMLNKVGQIIE